LVHSFTKKPRRKKNKKVQIQKAPSLLIG